MSEVAPLDPEFTWAKSAMGDIVRVRGGDGRRLTFVGFAATGLAMVEWTETVRGIFVREKQVKRKDKFRCRDLERVESPNRSPSIEELLQAVGMDRQGS